MAGIHSLAVAILNYLRLSDILYDSDYSTAAKLEKHLNRLVIK
jgi:hypothetical protein